MPRIDEGIDYLVSTGHDSVATHMLRTLVAALALSTSTTLLILALLRALYIADTHMHTYAHR